MFWFMKNNSMTKYFQKYFGKIQKFHNFLWHPKNVLPWSFLCGKKRLKKTAKRKIVESIFLSPVALNRNVVHHFFLIVVAYLQLCRLDGSLISNALKPTITQWTKYRSPKSKVHSLAKTWIYLTPYVYTERIFDSRQIMYNIIFLKKAYRSW